MVRRTGQNTPEKGTFRGKRRALPFVNVTHGAGGAG
jgi:hypothetical protein